MINDYLSQAPTRWKPTPAKHPQDGNIDACKLENHRPQTFFFNRAKRYFLTVLESVES